MDLKISIIISFFNSESTLKRSVDSVISQSNENWELILVNDGSTDQSEIVVKSFLSDKRISYYYQENKGVSAARNLGASNANGNWLIFLDSDDMFRPDFFELFNKELQYSDEFDFLIFGINRIKDDLENNLLPKDGQYFSRIPGTFILRKAIFDRVEGYDERFRFAENTELFHRLELIKAAGKNIAFVSLNYFDNPTGGSKNLKNMVDSLSLFLEKHDMTLTPHVKYLYHQIIGVNWMRFRNFPQARQHLLKAIKYKPFRPGTWLRFGIACFPGIAKRLYSETVHHG
ncbi:glycosyltransferase family A protein [Algoriphagus namhaensis]